MNKPPHNATTDELKFLIKKFIQIKNPPLEKKADFSQLIKMECLLRKYNILRFFSQEIVLFVADSPYNSTILKENATVLGAMSYIKTLPTRGECLYYFSLLN